MRHQISLLLGLLFFWVFSSVPVLAENTVVTLYGDNSYPPYSYEEDGAVKGIYPEIIREAAARLSGFSLEIRLRPWRRLLQMAERGEAFAVFPPYYRPIEREYLGRYSVPILDEVTAVFCNNEVLAAPRPVWPDDYFGLKIGKNLSFSTGGPAFDQAAMEGKVWVEEGAGTKINVRKLLEGRIDCYMNDRIAVLWTLKEQDDGQFRYSGKINEGATIRMEQGYVAYPILYDANYKQRFIKAFDEVIGSMKVDGTITRILQSYVQ